MKYAIPIGLALLIGISACLQRGHVQSAEPEKCGPLKDEVRAEGTETLQPDEGDTLFALSARPDTRSLEAAPVGRSAPAPSWRKLFNTVDHTLALTSIQQSRLVEIFRERENQINSCHDAIRNSGILDIRDYEWQVARMKEVWYRRIDVLLDGEQHEHFVALVAQGLFNEGLAFTVEPGMTVLD